MRQKIATFLLLTCSILSSTTAKEFCPFKLQGHYDQIYESGIKTPPYAHEDIDFNQWRAEASYSLPLCPEFGLRVLSGYEATHIGWEGNPFFSETDFSYLFGGLSFWWFTHPSITFTGSLAVNVDTETTNTKYMSLEWTAVAKYRYSCRYPFDVDLYFGLWGDAGQEDIELLPIIGLDFITDSCWQISAVFPINLSVGYRMTPALTLSTDTRFFYSRHRLASSEPFPEGIIKYKNSGLELGLSCEPSSAFLANVHVGWAFEGDLKIADKNGRNSSHYKSDGAVYLGANASVRF